MNSDTADQGPTEPDWVRHAIWWQVYPLGFLGADVSGDDFSGGVERDGDAEIDAARAPERDLSGLVDWLD